MEHDADLKRRFDISVEFVQKLPAHGPLEQSNERKLEFYSLYKQVVFGLCFGMP